jgi:hypothetical protein
MEINPILISNQSNLIISPILAQNLGKYRCKAKNAVGVTYKDLFLNKTNYEKDSIYYAYVDDNMPQIASYKKYEKTNQHFNFSKYSRNFKNLSIEIEFMIFKDKCTLFKISSKKSRKYLKVLIEKTFIKFK